MTEIQTRRGECLCGAVRFETLGQLTAPTACHCGMCRRWHGALGVYTSASNAAFRLSGGENLGWYRSGPESERGFCRICGSSLFWRLVDGDQIDIAMGAINPPTGLRLDRHIWVAHRGDYYGIGDGLPQYAASSTGAEPAAPAPPLPAVGIQPDRHSGNCLCGSVQFSVNGSMRDISTCHCRQCQRWHGHAAEYSKARWVQLDLIGANYLLWYRSSDTARRGSCRVCGASLFWERHGADAVSIAAGALNPPTGLRVRHHIFVVEGEDYSDIVDGLPQYPGTGGDSLPF
ncbi:hypothetical protein A8950_2698 [Dongia mobilis]|uniref:CENP-V/GFA domain-containing protein n=1 Tax=Dongia mobilis TaxID=578943 RepID=A0A4R6WNG3_9PROT|nr:GFA family protein [Dongia mobilis]TDQ80830.1 hypothetical protein A8950_2698 [Dongia mobilis]